MRQRAFAAFGSALLVASCQSENLSNPGRQTEAPNKEEAVAGAGQQLPGVIDFHESVRLPIEIVGRLQPDSPTTIRITATPTVLEASGELFVVLPEVEAARQTAWGDGFRIPVGPAARTARSSAFGRWQHAHEYGHAYHESALGGYQNPDCLSHNVGVPSTLLCAFVEGFGDYSGDVVFPNFSSWDWETFGGSANGSIDESRVARLLQDLIDSTNEPGDATTYPGSYIGEIIRTCSAKHGSFWRRADGIDHIIYCLENRIDPSLQGVYFVTRGAQPSQYSESATEPQGWLPANIRTTWLQALYQ